MKKFHSKKYVAIFVLLILVTTLSISLNTGVKSVDISGINECNGSNIHECSYGRDRSPPSVVNFNGPSSVNIGETAIFHVKAIDPNDLQIKYYFDWKIYPDQEFNVDEWTDDYYASGASIMIQHTFTIGGTYDVAVIAENINGEQSEMAVHDFNVDGGYTDIRYVNMWTEPDKFVPGQSVNFNSTIKNFGNRDYIEITHQPFVYFDGNRIGSSIILTTRLLEVDETNCGGYVEDYSWPDNYDEHEIKFNYLGASSYLYKSAVENEPPLKPSIEGPLRGTQGKVYPCRSSTSDPNEHKIYYLFDFGDGVLSGWLGPYESGQLAETSHKWYEGSYGLKAKAKDEYGLESEWSDPFPVHITKSRVIDTSFLRFLENYPQKFLLIRQLIQLLGL